MLKNSVRSMDYINKKKRPNKKSKKITLFEHPTGFAEFNEYMTKTLGEDWVKIDTKNKGFEL
jgi:hypothetical protein